jgi:hypothetical protein
MVASRAKSIGDAMIDRIEHGGHDGKKTVNVENVGHSLNGQHRPDMPLLSLLSLRALRALRVQFLQVEIVSINPSRRVR